MEGVVMEILYPIPAGSTIVDLFSYAQTTTHFVELTILAIFFVSYFALKRYETVRALPASLFLTFLSSLIFFLLGMVGSHWVISSAILFGLSALFLYIRKH